MPAPAWLVFAALLALQDGVFGMKAPVSAPKHEEPYDYYAKPKYDYKYGVEDFKTGDHKSHWEKRDGDEVTGAYTVMEPDGTFRTVTYTANKESGFNAVVTRHGKATHPQVLEGGEHSAPAHSEHSAHLEHSAHSEHLGHLGHTVQLRRPEHTVQLALPEHAVQPEHPEHTEHTEHPAVGTLHHLELSHHQPEIYEHKGESSHQVSQQLKRPAEADTQETRAPSSPAANAIPPPHFFPRINPSAKPAPFKQSQPQPQLSHSSSPRPRAASRQPAAASSPTRLPIYLASLPSSTSSPKLLQTSPSSFPSAFSHSTLYPAGPPSHQSSETASSSPKYGKLSSVEPVSFSTQSSSFLGLSTPFQSSHQKTIPAASAPGRPTRPYARAGDDAQVTRSGQEGGGDVTGFLAFRPAAAEEQEHGARLYRHGTQGESQRSFVEVGMGGYPDSAYEYVDSAQ